MTQNPFRITQENPQRIIFCNLLLSELESFSLFGHEQITLIPWGAQHGVSLSFSIIALRLEEPEPARDAHARARAHSVALCRAIRLRFLGVVLLHLPFQAGSRVHPKHARAFMRTLAKPGEVLRTLANPQHHIHNNLPNIHQSSGEGPPHSPEFR